MATFLETKRVVGEDTVAVLSHTMTLGAVPSHTEQTRGSLPWPATQLLMNYFPYAKPRPSCRQTPVSWTLLAAPGTLLTVPLQSPTVLEGLSYEFYQQ